MPSPDDTTGRIASVHDAESIVRQAWRRDLGDLRRLAREQLRAALADSLRAYEALRVAQRDGLPGRIVEAHMAVEAATRRVETGTCNRDRIEALARTEAQAGVLTETGTGTEAVGEPPSAADVSFPQDGAQGERTGGDRNRWWHRLRRPVREESR